MGNLQHYRSLKDKYLSSNISTHGRSQQQLNNNSSSELVIEKGVAKEKPQPMQLGLINANHSVS